MTITGLSIMSTVPVLPFDDESAAGVCTVSRDALELELELELEETAPAEVVARLVDDETADAEPTKKFSMITQVRQAVGLLLEGAAVALKAFTRPLIWKPGDETCCAYGSARSK